MSAIFLALGLVFAVRGVVTWNDDRSFGLLDVLIGAALIAMAVFP